MTMLASIAVFAQAILLAAPSTNVTLVSETKIEKAWERKVVMHDGNGKIMNDDEQVGELAEAAADREVAEQAGEISDAAKDAMLGQIKRLEDASKDAAKNAIAVALVMSPELTRENLTGFVVKETTDGSVDTQWVWYNKILSLKPNRYVVYEGIANCVTSKCEWVSWNEDGESIVVNGREWSGCHKCTVRRPAFAVSVPCLTNPNESRWGGPHGMEFGDMTLTMGDKSLVTAIITNRFDATERVLFDNGFFKGFIKE